MVAENLELKNLKIKTTDVDEVKEGLEMGLSFKNFDKFSEDDLIECVLNSK